MIRRLASGDLLRRVRDHAWSDRLSVFLALLALALALATQFSIGNERFIPNARDGFICAALILAASVVIRRTADQRPFELPRAWEWGIAAALVAIALLFRVYQLDSFPPGLWYDESISGLDAIEIMEHGNHLTVWKTSNNGHSTLFIYLLIGSFKVFGYTVFAMRIVPVIAGVAAVAIFYFFARRLLGVVPAIGATALLAVSRYASTFSRLSWEASLQPLFEIMAVYFFARALDTRRKLDWFMAGGSLAAGLYTYVAFRMVPLVMLFLVVYVAVTRPRLLRRSIPGLVLYLASFVVVVAPLGQYVVRHFDDVTTRQRDVSVFNDVDEADSYDPLRNNVKAVIKMMNVRGDPNPRHNLPDEPMLDGISGALLVLGIAAAAWSVRDWRRGGLLGWYALALVPSALTIASENPSAIRTIGAIPPMFLLIGLAIDVLYRAFSVDRWRQGAFAAILITLFAGSAAANYHVLFNRQAKTWYVYEMFQSSTTAAAEVAASETGDSQVYLSPSFLGPTTDVLTHNRPPFGLVQPVFNMPVPSTGGRDAIFVLDHKQRALEQYLLELYPSAKSERVTKRFDGIDYLSHIVVTVPASVVAALHRARADYVNDRGGTVSATDESALVHQWPQDLPSGLTPPFGFSWSGGILLNPVVTPSGRPILPFSGVRRLIFTSPGAIRLDIDGLGTREGRDSLVFEIPPELPIGLYAFRATSTVEAAGVTKLEWQREDEGALAREVIPVDALVSSVPTESGFLARHFQSGDWSGPVALRSLELHAYPSPRLHPPSSVILDATLNVPESGLYEFAVNAEWPVVVQIDGADVVDANEALGSRRVEGSVELAAGPHAIAIGYVDVSHVVFQVEWRAPGGGEWRVLSGADVTPLTQP